MLVTSIFSFSHNVFKRHLSQGCLKSELCGKELITAVEPENVQLLNDSWLGLIENGGKKNSIKELHVQAICTLTNLTLYKMKNFRLCQTQKTLWTTIWNWMKMAVHSPKR